MPTQSGGALTPEEIATKERKKIPATVILVGTFQVAAALGTFLVMAITGSWNSISILLALFYGALGAGVLAVMEWARFLGVIIHLSVLPLILARAVLGGQAGIWSAIQILVAVAIFYVLTRPYIRAKFRRQPYPMQSTQKS